MTIKLLANNMLEKYLFLLQTFSRFRIMLESMLFYHYFSMFWTVLFWLYLCYVTCGYDCQTLSTTGVMMATYVELIVCFCMYSCKVSCRLIYSFSNKRLVVHDLKIQDSCSHHDMWQNVFGIANRLTPTPKLRINIEVETLLRVT